MAREGQGYPCYQRDMMMIHTKFQRERERERGRGVYLCVRESEKRRNIVEKYI